MLLASVISELDGTILSLGVDGLDLDLFVFSYQLLALSYQLLINRLKAH